MAALTDAAVLSTFDAIRVWQRGASRAVHKPLLVLLMLGRLVRGETEFPKFVTIEADFRDLLGRFAPEGAASSRHLPFWHLRTDGIWTLRGDAAVLARPPAATPTLTEVRQLEGSFTPEILNALCEKPVLISAVAQRIVNAHFPESLQQDVLEAVGISGEATTDLPSDRRRRDPAFRGKVLMAYEYRCCVCAHDLRLGVQVIGLEAAHIKWFQAGGPDIETNGLALCSLHHKLFDLGVFTVLPDDMTIVVSQLLNGGAQVRDQMLTYHGANLISPQSHTYRPFTDYLRWHETEVFRAPGRDL